MVDLIFNKLFAYGDKLHDEGNEHDRKIVHECERLVHEAWKESNAFKSLIQKQPDNDVEAIVLSIKGIKVYRDTLDDSYFYELDGNHFDHPNDVVKYLIRIREGERDSVRKAEKRRFLLWIAKNIQTLSSGDDLKTRKVQNVRGKDPKETVPDMSTV